MALLRRWRLALVLAAGSAGCTDPVFSSADASGEQNDGGTTGNDAATTTPAPDAATADAASTGDAAIATPSEDAATPLDAAVADAGETLDSAAVDAGSDAANPGTDAGNASVVLDLSTHQPPTTIPAGEWPAQMRTGHWRFTWTPNFASNAVPVDMRPNVILFQFGGTENTNDAIWLEKQGTNCKAWVTTDSGVLLAITSLVFSAGQPISYELDLAQGRWTVSGATAGNGTLSNGGPFSWPNATLFVGRSPGGLFERFMGTFSNVEAVP
jgi:hypothetical protein